jgi:hypothetical protein
MVVIFLIVGGSSGNGTGLGSRLEKRAPEPQLPWGCGLVQVATPSLGAPAAFVRMGELVQQVMELGKLFEENVQQVEHGKGRAGDPAVQGAGFQAPPRGAEGVHAGVKAPGE